MGERRDIICISSRAFRPAASLYETAAQLFVIHSNKKALGMAINQPQRLCYAM